MNGSRETERVRRYYDEFAQNYDRLIGYSEKLLFGGGREWVCAQASGDVLEIAVGTGRNLPYYPRDIRLTGIDISPAMLAVAQERANELGREVDLRAGDAQALEFPDARFDTVVSTLSLCTIPDDRRAVAEVRRVLRPGGRFFLLEHVRSPVRVVRVFQRVLDPIFVRFSADHLLREPLDDLAAEGFVIDRLERSTWGIVERVAAHKPA
jgi:ubiquinone/menaquinone biosynthesis C-methylase UbiE